RRRRVPARPGDPLLDPGSPADAGRRPRAARLSVRQRLRRPGPPSADPRRRHADLRDRAPGDRAMTPARPVAETERLALRKFAPGDAPFVVRLLNEPSFLENIGDKGVRTVQQAARYLADGPMRSYARHGHGLYLVALKDSQEPIGMCGIL